MISDEEETRGLTDEEADEVLPDVDDDADDEDQGAEPAERNAGIGIGRRKRTSKSVVVPLDLRHSQVDRARRQQEPGAQPC